MHLADQLSKNKLKIMAVLKFYVTSPPPNYVCHLAKLSILVHAMSPIKHCFITIFKISKFSGFNLQNTYFLLGLAMP
jgi:hypothetical protein